MWEDKIIFQLEFSSQNRNSSKICNPSIARITIQTERAITKPQGTPRVIDSISLNFEIENRIEKIERLPFEYNYKFQSTN